ncbi:Coiled-coil domain-containing protein [Paragonimus westermani]|uniref:Coiled-coil domain-containing protein 39 n=1 Tax=Paragonimus westermani TaxID=34504 RepID=A0A8T0DQ49_9TREM|nr:Coiled-coil domain-containing protein [Paragonimus westermani]
MMDHSRILIEEALKETGWQSNFAFPMASEENKYLINLLSEVKVKTRLLEEGLIEYREKNDKLRTHMALIQHERAITEAVLLERQRECDALRNQMCLAEREIGRTQQDLRQLKAKRKDVNERIGSLENEIFIRSNELTSIKSQMDYDQNLIDVYLDACEEDIRLRERLAAVQHVDDSRFAMLNSEAGRLSDKRREVRQKLDTVVSKSDALRLRVGAASDRCREENQARRDVLHVWETCVNQMIKRDEDYTTLDKEYDEMLEKINAQTKRVEETKKISLLVEDDNKNSEKSITETNKEIWDARCQLQKINEDLDATQDELKSLQRTLERTDSDFRSSMAQTKVVKQTIQDLRTNLGQLLDKIDTTEKMYQRVRNKRLSVEQLTKMAEEQLLANEKCQKQAITYHQQLTATSFKKIDILNRVNAESTTLQALLSGDINTLKGLKKHVDSRESELIKLNELIYKSLLYSQRLEQRIAKLEADPLLSHDEIILKNQQIKSLQSELDARTKTCLSLSGMINQFRNDKRICKMRSERIQTELEQSETQLVTAQLTMANTKLALKKHEDEWREMLVECNINRHQVKRMETRLNQLRNQVMNEEARQLQLDALEHEMAAKLNARKNCLQAELRQMGARMVETKAELTSRQRRLDQIIARYNVTVTVNVAANEDALGARMRYLLEVSCSRCLLCKCLYSLYPFGFH